MKVFLDSGPMRSVGPMSRAQILLRTGVLLEGPLPVGLQGPLAMHTMTWMTGSCAKAHYQWHNVNLLERLLF